MATTTIQQEMLRYFQQLNNEEQKSVLMLIKTFSSNREKHSQPQTLEQYNKELEDADAEIESGDYITQEDIKKMFLK